jgi:hypothetical protein
VQLQLLKTTEAKSLFEDLPVYQQSAVVRSAVADCNGHPRTLAVLRDVLTNVFHNNPDGITRQRIVDAMMASLQPWITSYSEVPASVVVNALLNRKVGMHELTSDKDRHAKQPYSYFVETVSMLFYTSICVSFTIDL